MNYKNISLEEEIKDSLQNWQQLIKDYQKPCSKKAILQIVNTFLPFLGLWVLMYLSLNWSIWITIGLGIINSFFLARIFIIQHDCGHQSFLKSKKLNNLIGVISSFFTSIPYKYWAKVHAFHHGHTGQLEHRDIGDINFSTVAEYRNKSKWGKLKYRIFRNPIVLFVLAPVIYVMVTNRLPMYNFKGLKKVKKSQLINNILILGVYTLLAFLLGWKEFLFVQLFIIVGFSIIAFWFFYVQHQHEEAYKQWRDNWNFLVAAIKGSTYYKLPRVFNWLTGNIGLHHIHHLSPRIPNYNLPRCARENPIFQKYVTTINFRESLKCMFHKLWDEETERMITFKEYYQKERQQERVFA